MLLSSFWYAGYISGIKNGVLFPGAMVTFYFTKTTESFSAITGVSYGTKTLLLNDSVVVSILLITRSLDNVETNLRHLK